ncbi:MAG TPA: amidohydrolase family protein [Bryobacteraceae bacterium]|nr:amidohydrolase family protein [Bryobacteraceae bacterium]
MIVDTNVNLSRWPFRRLAGDDTPELVARLRQGNVVQAWAGSFDGLLHKDIGGVNARLAADCRSHGKDFLVPFGSINPKLPGWREDVRRCHEEYKMPGIRLHPNYHGYLLSDPVFAELLRLAASLKLIVQLVLTMEDIRTQHPLLRVPPVDVTPLSGLLEKEPSLRVMLLNWTSAVRGQRLKVLMDAGTVCVDISTVEGIEGVARLADQVTPERMLFGSHYPFLPPGSGGAEDEGVRVARRPPKDGVRGEREEDARTRDAVDIFFKDPFPMTLTILLMLAALRLPAQQSAGDPLLRWMDAIAQQQLQAREQAVAQVRTVAGAERRKQLVRTKILEALGGLPDYSGPLNAKVTGRIQADGYVIEKVIYESLPGFYVTANLYRPNQPGRYPGVLLQAGHTQEGKAEPQRLGANLALKGFVSLAFDPAGQGEREQTYDPQLKAPAAGWSVNEHLHATVQSSLVGEGVARYFIWDARRSLDYLARRPEVDPARLGAAGCSGGGALTTFIGGLDARLKAVIPACFPNSYRLMFASASNFNSEMTLPQHIFRGLDTADFVELSAPTPWLLQATEHDYFTPPRARLVYEEARRWYKLYGAEDKIALAVRPGPHGTPLVSREGVYEWFIRWLKDGKGDPREQPVKTYANRELLVTKTGRVEDEPGSRKLYQLILDTYRAKRKQGTTAELLAELRRLKIPTNGSAPAVKILDDAAGDGFRNQHIRFESEPGIDLDARLYIPPGSGRKQAVLISGGKVIRSTGGEHRKDRARGSQARASPLHGS